MWDKGYELYDNYRKAQRQVRRDLDKGITNKVHYKRAEKFSAEWADFEFWNKVLAREIEEEWRKNKKNF